MRKSIRISKRRNAWTRENFIVVVICGVIVFLVIMWAYDFSMDRYMRVQVWKFLGSQIRENFLFIILFLLSLFGLLRYAKSARRFLEGG